jgi:hypothetical protein
MQKIFAMGWEHEKLWYAQDTSPMASSGRKERLSPGPLLLDCPAWGSRGESTHKGHLVLPFMSGMLPFISGRSVTPFCSPEFMAGKPDLGPAWPSWSSHFWREQRQIRWLKAIGSSPSPEIKDTKFQS